MAYKWNTVPLKNVSQSLLFYLIISKQRTKTDDCKMPSMTKSARIKEKDKEKAGKISEMLGIIVLLNQCRRKRVELK